MGYTQKELNKKIRLEKLYGITSNAKHPLILIYGNPDPDSLASSLAMKEILSKKYVNPLIMYSGEASRLENKAMMQMLKIPAVKLEERILKDADLIILVDCQPEFFKDIHLPRCDIIIDHHPRKSHRDYPYIDIRPKCLAASSILTQYLKLAHIPITMRLATALYYGIQTDTRNSQRIPSPIDLEAIQFLENKIDRKILHRIEFSTYSLDFLDYFTIALIKLHYSNYVLYSHMGPIPSYDVCVQIAAFLIRVEEANWAVVSGAYEKKLIIVFRCDGNKKNAGKIAQAAFGNIGSAGGHSTMARAEINETSLPEGIILTQNERLEHFILDSLAKVEKGFRPICRILHH